MAFFVGIAGFLPTLYEWLIKSFSMTYDSPAGAGVMFGCALLCMVIPYLLGSINPAVLISTTVYHKDIRTCGSGNAGTTNMLRTFGKKAAIATFLLDLGKAALSYILGGFLLGIMGGAIAGLFVVLGHMFPIFAKFKGGKGVACLSMVVLLQSPVTFLILLAVFLIIVIGTHMVSMGSVMCAMLYPIFLNIWAGNDAGIPLNVAISFICGAFVVFMHRENIKRIWNHTESKLDFSKLSKKKKQNDQSEEQK